MVSKMGNFHLHLKPIAIGNEIIIMGRPAAVFEGNSDREFYGNKLQITESHTMKQVGGDRNKVLEVLKYLQKNGFKKKYFTIVDKDELGLVEQVPLLDYYNWFYTDMRDLESTIYARGYFKKNIEKYFSTRTLEIITGALKDLRKIGYLRCYVQYANDDNNRKGFHKVNLKIGSLKVNTYIELLDQDFRLNYDAFLKAAYDAYYNDFRDRDWKHTEVNKIRINDDVGWVSKYFKLDSIEDWLIINGHDASKLLAALISKVTNKETRFENIEEQIRKTFTCEEFKKLKLYESISNKNLLT